MRNQKLYKEYEINGWPCHFLSLSACNKYNKLLATHCNRLPDGATEFTSWQTIRRYLYLLFFLGAYDRIMFQIERRNRN